METSKILIESPGLFTTVQDTGRFGYQRYGMPVSGAMDPYSLRLANILVGNLETAAGLEVTLKGPELRFCGACVIAICGADMQAKINGREIKVYQAIIVKDGDLLSFGQVSCGCRTYISFAGGVDVPMVMGSRATYTRAAIGGYHGRALKKGDEIPIGESINGIRLGIAPAEAIPDYHSSRPIRIISGPESGLLTTEGRYSLLNHSFLISNQSDRMGYRLEGQYIAHKKSSDGIVSAGVIAGTIQLPGNGHPIIMMADGQTTGGYPRIAVVISCDMSRLAQVLPGDGISFDEIGVEEAISLNRHMFNLLESVRPVS